MLLRTHLARAARQNYMILREARRDHPRMLGSSSEKQAARSGFLEQMRRNLLPEVFGIGGQTVRKDQSRKPSARGSRGHDERDQDFKRTLVREETVALRERVISRYASEAAPRAVPLPPQLVVVDGSKGVGKSSILEQVVAFARMKGFIVMYIPDSQAWTHGAGFFAATAVEDKDPLFDGLGAVRFYERPTQMHHVFQAMLDVHSDDLEGVNCREEYATDLTAQCRTLLDLALLGNQLLDDVDSNWRQNPGLAGEVFSRFVKELCACKSKPVAFVIDNYERFIGLTCMVNERAERLHANCIRAVADHFGRDAIEHTAAAVSNGFVLLATDPLYQFEDWRRSRLRSGVDYPLSDETLDDPSGRKWVADLKSRVKDVSSERKLLVEVPNLTSSELKTMCSTFVAGGLRRLVDSSNPGPEQERLVALAGGRGDLLKKIAVSR